MATESDALARIKFILLRLVIRNTLKHNWTITPLTENNN